jgi:hypothetical protein
VLQFNRWRIDGKKAWTTLEEVFKAISPDLARSVDLALSIIGKEQDASFDLKETLIGGLGDDFIMIEKPPQSSGSVEGRKLYVMGSPNPEKLALGVRKLLLVMPWANPGATWQDREFLGRTIHSLALRPTEGAGNTDTQSSFLHLAASGGYLAASTDVAALEEFLRTVGGVENPLRAEAKLNEAAQQVGGMSTGIFLYENQKEMMRRVVGALEAVSKSARSLPLASLGGITPRVGAAGDWIDASRLPPFEQIAGFFSFAVYSCQAEPEGIRWRFFAADPPAVRQTDAGQSR